MATAAELAILIKARDESARVFAGVEGRVRALGKTMGTVLRAGGLAAAAGIGLAAVALKGMVQEAMEAERIVAEAAKDPLAGYSDTVLLRHGLVSWRGDAYELACDDERKDELDETTRRWAALQVLDVSHISEGEAGRSDPTSNGTGAESQPASLGSGSLS